MEDLREFLEIIQSYLVKDGHNHITLFNLYKEQFKQFYHLLDIRDRLIEVNNKFDFNEILYKLYNRKELKQYEKGDDYIQVIKDIFKLIEEL